MFEDHLHQFIASSRTTTTSSSPQPITTTSSFSSSLQQQTNNTNTFSSFDPYHHHHHQTSHLHPNFLHPLHHHHHHQQQQSPKNEAIIISNKQGNNLVVDTNLEIERDRSLDPWSSDEVLALLRIRSTMENWYPEYTWEQVSRKLAQAGFKRSAEKCKEKFEEESSRYFSNNNNNHNDKSYRIFSELEEVYNNNGEQQELEQEQVVVSAETSKEMDKASGEVAKGQDKVLQEEDVEEDSRTVTNPCEVVEKENGSSSLKKKKSKRKREKKFEMFKCFCEDIVRKMMAQQEEMHNKLIEDMVKRDEEKLAREEAWKKQEFERLNKELEMRTQEQAAASDRQSTIIKFLSAFTSSSSHSLENQNVVIESNHHRHLTSNPNPPINSKTQNNTNVENSGSSSSPIRPSTSSLHENPSSSTDLTPQNPNLIKTQENPSKPISVPSLKAQKNHTLSEKDDIGKRWPRDEVLALINIRCSLYNNGEDKEGATTTTTIKAPLWERISQGMLELGYKRSAKRCKEKWENINKYFRKTKDINKKRSLDSRTCPYFHQLSTLYNQGTLVAGSPHQISPENTFLMPESHSNFPESNRQSDEKQIAQSQAQAVPAFDFEY